MISIIIVMSCPTEDVQIPASPRFGRFRPAVLVLGAMAPGPCTDGEGDGLGDGLNQLESQHRCVAHLGSWDRLGNHVNYA